MVKQAEERIALIVERMKDPQRQLEIEAGKNAIKVEMFNVDAVELWPRLYVTAKYRAGVVKCTASVKGEPAFCLVHEEPFAEFPSIHLQAMLGLAG